MCLSGLKLLGTQKNHLIGGWCCGWTDRQTDRTILIHIGVQLVGMKAIKHCTCNRSLLISMKCKLALTLRTKFKKTDNNYYEKK